MSWWNFSLYAFLYYRSQQYRQDTSFINLNQMCLGVKENNLEEEYKDSKAWLSTHIKKEVAYNHFWGTIGAIHLPPITLSIACSKCFWFIASERCLAAIKAASLQTLAISAPKRQGKNYWSFSTLFSEFSINIIFPITSLL